MAAEGAVRIPSPGLSCSEGPLTLLAGGFSTGPDTGVQVAGEIQSTLVLTGRDIGLGADTQIHGTLVLSDLTADSVPEFRGTVLRDRRQERDEFAGVHCQG